MASTANSRESKKRNSTANKVLPPISQSWSRYKNRPDPLRFGHRAGPDQLSVEGSNAMTSPREAGSGSGRRSRNVSDAKYSTASAADSSMTAYPFLQAFIDKQTGKRFSKRVVFDHSHFDNLLG